jgi:hypothetical protein
MRNDFLITSLISATVVFSCLSPVIAAEQSLDRTVHQENSTIDYPRQSEWYNLNLTKQNIPSELNKLYHLVGAPAKSMLVWFGHPFQEKGSSEYFGVLGPYDSSALEIEFSPDRTNVSRFRFLESTAGGLRSGPYSDWQTSDLNVKEGDTSLKPVWHGVGPNPLALTGLSRRFDDALWNAHNQPLRGSKRNLMVYDLVHSVNVVGMDQNSIHDLLGDPSCRETTGPGKESEYYWLYGSSDCGGLPADCLEIGYSNSRVWGFRLVVRKDVPFP